jgi:hypothetical protein
MGDKSTLKIITAQSPKVEPPRPLGDVGRALWDRITGAYNISDEGGREMLVQACLAADRAESLRAQIDAEGEFITTKQGRKDNPLLKHELGARNFVCRTLLRLGLNVEPLRPGPGRPGTAHWPMIG